MLTKEATPAILHTFEHKNKCSEEKNTSEQQNISICPLNYIVINIVSWNEIIEPLSLRRFLIRSFPTSILSFAA